MSSRKGEWSEGDGGRGECSFKLYKSYGAVNFMWVWNGARPDQAFSADYAIFFVVVSTGSGSAKTLTTTQILG